MEVQRSAHFEYWSRPDSAHDCKNTLETLERHYASLQDYLQFDAPTQRLRYHRFENRDALQAEGACSAGNSACYFEAYGIYASDELELHELVHAYLQVYGDRSQLLEEGTAQALSCAERPPPLPVTGLSLEQAFDAEVWQTANTAELRQLYRAGSLLVAHLLRERGPRRFMQWYRRLDRLADVSEARVEFEDVYAQSLDDVWVEAMQAVAADAGCVRVWECDQQFEVDTDSFDNDSAGELELHAGDCADERFRVLELSDPTWLDIETRVSGVLVGSCEHLAMPHDHFRSSNATGQVGERFIVGLDPGRYFASFEALDERSRSSDADASVRRLPDNLVTGGEACVMTGVLESAIERDLTVAVSESFASELTLRWRDANFDDAEYYMLCSDGLQVLWCDTCSTEVLTCSAACDRNVVVNESNEQDAAAALRLGGPPESRQQAARWLRLQRL